jgi:hypothetical protein
MSKPGPINHKMRVYHRYLGFFLAGIMAIYALSGVIMVFRNTDFLKKEVLKNETIEPNLKPEDLGQKIKIKGLKVDKEENGIIYFKEGTYNIRTGEAQYTKKEMPYLIGRMEHLHKATTKDPLYFLNLFFGLALLFFVISSFYMFLPGTQTFKKGLYFTLAGIILTLIMLFV